MFTGINKSMMMLAGTNAEGSQRYREGDDSRWGGLWLAQVSSTGDGIRSKVWVDEHSYIS